MKDFILIIYIAILISSCTQTLAPDLPQAKIVRVDPNIATSGDGSSWAKAYKTVNEALKEADATPLTIYIAGGVFKGTAAPNMVDIDNKKDITIKGGYYSDDETLTKRDSSNHATVFDGDNVVDHIFKVTNSEAIKFEGVKVIQAKADITHDNEIYAPTGQGAGMYINKSNNITLKDCYFSNNIAEVHGGAVSIEDSSNITIEDSKFNENSEGAVTLSSVIEINIKNTSFENNKVVNNDGGALFFDNKTEANLSDVSFINNESKNYAGALAIYNQSKVLLGNAKFDGNLAKQDPQFSYGDAIRIADSSELSMAPKTKWDFAHFNKNSIAMDSTAILEPNFVREALVTFTQKEEHKIDGRSVTTSTRLNPEENK